MKLNELLNGTGIEIGFLNPDTEITSITCDSRRVEPGCLFVCIVGVAVGMLYLYYVGKYGFVRAEGN